MAASAKMLVLLPAEEFKGLEDLDKMLFETMKLLSLHFPEQWEQQVQKKKGSNRK
jgi:hypothetical protein